MLYEDGLIVDTKEEPAMLTDGDAEEDEKATLSNQQSTFYHVSRAR
jgi:hypothetical protein